MPAPHLRIVESSDHVAGTRLAAGPFHSTEIRWFAEAALPETLTSWFTAQGRFGVVESRCDEYQLTGSPIIGVKRRDQQVLEVKVRRSLGRSFSLTDGVAGHIETWTKWRPAPPTTASPATFVPWVEIHKTVVTRSFHYDNGSAAPVVAPDRSMAGCDVELAALRVGELDSWTFACEAFGPRANQLDAIEASLETLTSMTPYPPGFAECFDQSAGYPEWLLRAVTPGVAAV